MHPVIVINPNSTEAVTREMDKAIEPLRMPGGPPIDCITLQEGPPGIETNDQVKAVVNPLCSLVLSKHHNASAFVIACYSDPGLNEIRKVSLKPVFGIAESAMATALTLGERFGIISILDTSIARHIDAVRVAGLESRFAGDIAIGVGVTGLIGNETDVQERILNAGQRLREEHGANVLILGCAGMARFKLPLAKEISLPVVEPTQAAVTLAIGAIQLQ